MRDRKGSYLHPTDVILSQDYYTKATIRTESEEDEVKSAAEVAGSLADALADKNGFERGSREHSALVEAALRGISHFSQANRIEYPTQPQGLGLKPWQVLVRSTADEMKMNTEGEYDD